MSTSTNHNNSIVYEIVDTTERYVHLLADDLQNFAIFYDPEIDLAYPDFLQYAATILSDLTDLLDHESSMK